LGHQAEQLATADTEDTVATADHAKAATGNTATAAGTTVATEVDTEVDTTMATPVPVDPAATGDMATAAATTGDNEVKINAR